MSVIETPEWRLKEAGFTMEMGLWRSPDGQQILHRDDAVTKLDAGEIEPQFPITMKVPHVGFVEALPDDLVDRICTPPDPFPWIDPLAEAIASKLADKLNGRPPGTRTKAK